MTYAQQMVFNLGLREDLRDQVLAALEAPQTPVERRLVGVLADIGTVPAAVAQTVQVSVVSLLITLVAQRESAAYSEPAAQS